MACAYGSSYRPQRRALRRQPPVVGGAQDGGVHVALLVGLDGGREFEVFLLDFASLGALMAQNEVHLRSGRANSAK